MWIGLDGSFNMKSLNAMVKEKPSVTLDFTKEENTYYQANSFNILNTGLRYENEEVNKKFSEYIFKNTEAGEIKELTKRTYTKQESKHITIDEIDPFKTDQVFLAGYSHDLLPTGYNSAIYLNSFVNAPLEITFRMKNLYSNQLVPGKMIAIKFPDSQSKEDTDPLFSGNYLITHVAKKDVNNIYTIDIKCVSCSVLKDSKDRFFHQ
jgi:hypothetical protein